MKTSTTAPPLARHEGSWIITLSNGQAIETFSRRNADLAAEAGYRVETITEYLGAVQRRIDQEKEQTR